MISPTGNNTVRFDKVGAGNYGASRGGRTHEGADYVCRPGQRIVSPIDGVIERIANPYAGEKFSGLVIRGADVCVKIFYFLPIVGIVGDHVKQGQPIGDAQDVREMYGKDCTPHIHIEIVSINPDIFISQV